jgi:transposase
MREYVHGELPEAYQPDEQMRTDRRLVGLREDLVRRQTSVRNQIKAHISHETWADTDNLWSGRGIKKLKALVSTMSEDDQFVMEMKIGLLEVLGKNLAVTEARLMKMYERNPTAQAIDAIPGIGPVSAVSIVARIGSIDRFKEPESLISYAGLAPGVRSSDSTSKNLSIGGGGTDKHLRHYMIEATVWARKTPRYAEAYQRVEKKRGRKIGRIVVARMILRSIHKMMTDDVEFNPAA